MCDKLSDADADGATWTEPITEVPCHARCHLKLELFDNASRMAAKALSTTPVR